MINFKQTVAKRKNLDQINSALRSVTVGNLALLYLTSYSVIYVCLKVTLNTRYHHGDWFQNYKKRIFSLVELFFLKLHIFRVLCTFYRYFWSLCEAFLIFCTSGTR